MQFGLSWEFSDYYRTTVHLNRDAAKNLKFPHSLHPSYSLKAAFLKNVQATDALYLTSSESVIAPSRASDIKSACCGLG